MTALQELLTFIPETVRQMPEYFTTHQLEVPLWHEHQNVFVPAMAKYSDDQYQKVGSRVGRWLREHPDLVEYRGQVMSTNIFGRKSCCGS